MIIRTDTINLTNKLDEAFPQVKAYLNMVAEGRIELKLKGAYPNFVTTLLDDVEVDEISGDGDMTYCAHGYLKGKRINIFGTGWDGGAIFYLSEEEE